MALTLLHAHNHAMQGHILAARAIGDIYCWGKGVAKDYERAMAAYKVAAEGGDALSQSQVGMMYYYGLGVAVDYQRARAWSRRPRLKIIPAVGQLGGCIQRQGRDPSWRGHELYKRAIELGDSKAVKNMQILTRNIQEVS